MHTSALVAIALGFLAGQERLSPLDAGLVRAVELDALPGTLVQHFRLDAEPVLPRSPTAAPKDAGDAEEARAAGLMRFLTGPDPEGGLRVELELVFFEPPLRVIHIERATAERRQLVYREVREGGAGRTLFLTGSPRDGYESSELGGAASVRRALSDRGEFPLFLVESARRGLLLPEIASVYEPLAAGFEEAALEVGPRGTPALELLRPDGSRRFRVRFDEGLPVEWRWQPGAPVGRAISPEEYECLRADAERRREERRMEERRREEAQRSGERERKERRSTPGST